jgi:23S rRNA (uracil1939-C5)-methyltransferase
VLFAMRDAPALDIVRLGGQGDGIALVADGERFVPFALPGERVREASQGLPAILSSPSPERRAPICKHFGTCGGCVAQHMSDALYAEWKRGIVVEALRHRGIDAEVAPLARIPPASRRRAVLTAQRTASGVVLGYHRRRSHELFAVEECPVLTPAIALQLAALRAVIATLDATDVRVTVLATPSGLDVELDAEKPALASKVARLVQAAAPLARIARVSTNGATVFEHTRPMLDIDGTAVVPPPGAFVQAVGEAERLMAEAVLQATPRAKRIADLFTGIGTFTLRLARRARVLAIDSDRRAIAALEAAARQGQGLKPIETRVRDLFRDPLSPRELDVFDAVVFDPPYAGAKVQAEALARAKVPVVAAVSCNPATLARDLRILVDGGYRIERIVPIDQFLYSAHVETVAILRRGR